MIRSRYDVCPGTSAICPVGNMCCGNLCLSGGTIDSDSSNQNNNNNDTNGTCCMDMDTETTTTTTPMLQPTTGCGVNYVCSATKTMCTAIQDDIPAQIPRTKLCRFTDAMTHVYAMPMMKVMTTTNHNATTTTNHPDGPDRGRKDTLVQRVPVAAYLSTMGPIHDDDDENAGATSFEHITRVVILIHGSRRNVEDYLCCVNAAIPTVSSVSSSSQGYVDPSTVLILAPWFPTEDDGIINITKTKSQRSDNQTMEVLRWIGNNNDPFSIQPIFHTWRYGAGAIHDHNISSYDVVDLMLTRHLYNRTKFPSLQHIVVTGHSAGGQYVQRWALLSNSIQQSDVVVVAVDHGNFDGDGIAANRTGHILTNEYNRVASSSRLFQYPVVHTVVANPKSYAYLDQRRWMNMTTTTTYETKANHNTSEFILEFRVPSEQEIAQCLTYNDWEWGFDHRVANGTVLVAPYVSNAIAAAGGMEAMVQRYAERHVVYLSGEDDVLYNGDCNDRIQGPNRRTRSERYFAAIQQYYPSSSTTNTTAVNRHVRSMVPNVPHDHCLMYQSIPGQQALFGVFDR